MSSDLTQVYETDSQGTGLNEERLYGDPEPPKGKLLEESDEKKVARTLIRWWEAQNDIMEPREARWRVNHLRRQNYNQVRVIYDTEKKRIREYLPPNAVPDPIVTNKAAGMARRLASMMFTDPPALTAEPASDDPADQDAAEFQTRILEQATETTRAVERSFRAFDRASSSGSGFVHFYVQDRAGGRKPLKLMVGVGAMSVDEVETNPETGRPWQDWVEKYVTPSGGLSIDRAEAAVVDLPGLRAENINAHNLRYLPHTAMDVADADGILIARYSPWRTIRNAFPDLDLDEDERKRLFNYRPHRERYLMDPAERAVFNDPPDDEDERLVFNMLCYMTSCPDYPDGYYAWTLGDAHVLEKSDWMPEDEVLPIPVAQFKQNDNGDNDGFGYGLMDWAGTANEIRAEILARLLDHLEKQLNRKEYVPIGSTLRPEHFRLPGKVPIEIPPGTQPIWEERDPFPPDGLQAFQIITQEMDTNTKLSQVAQGVESPRVQSGKHAQAIVAQAMASLWEEINNTQLGFRRCGLIMVSLMRAFYDRSRLMTFQDEDGAFKQVEWSGADLSAEHDIQLRSGSLSLMSPLVKAQFGAQLFQMGVIDQMDLQEYVTSSLSSVVNLKRNSYRDRIRRQLHEWKKGPPPDWRPVQAPAIDPNTGQPAYNPETFEPVLEQIAGPAILNIFDENPADDLPFVAAIRLRELSAFMSGSRFRAYPVPWQFALINEFMRASMAQQQVFDQAPQPGQPVNRAMSPAQQEERMGIEQVTVPVPQEANVQQ